MQLPSVLDMQHIMTAELREFELYPAEVTGDLLTSGPTTGRS